MKAEVGGGGWEVGGVGRRWGMGVADGGGRWEWRMGVEGRG